MKSTLVLLAALAVTQAAVPELLRRRLRGNDFKTLLDEFLNVANFDGIKELIKEKAESGDPDLAIVMAYLISDPAQCVYLCLHKAGYWSDFSKFLDEGGLDMEKFEADLEAALGWSGTPTCEESSVGRNVHSVKDLLDEILQQVPISEVTAWAIEKVATDPSMESLIAKLESAEGAETYHDFIKCKEYQQLLEKLNDDGIDTKPIIEAIETFFGW